MPLREPSKERGEPAHSSTPSSDLQPERESDDAPAAVGQDSEGAQGSYASIDSLPPDHREEPFAGATIGTVLGGVAGGMVGGPAGASARVEGEKGAGRRTTPEGEAESVARDHRSGPSDDGEVLPSGRSERPQ